MDIVFHYPPELFQLLVDTIPLLCRSKKDVLLFFRGAGVDLTIWEDLWQRVEQNRESINKYEITRVVLTRLNENGEQSLRERREILRRITEFEDFSTCWPTDQLKAKGLVSEIRRVVNVKDSFTRMDQERERERLEKSQEYQRKVAEIQRKQAALDGLKRDFYALFALGIDRRQARGTLLEKILNNLFEIHGISIRESFRVTGEDGKGILEQVDGVVELDGAIYLVEMKWVQNSVDVDHVSRHLVRVYHRGCARGIFISASEYTEPALKICQEALLRTVVILCTLEEIVKMLEQGKDLKILLKEKIQAALLDKNPYVRF